jgi:hypothetical protein
MLILVFEGYHVCPTSCIQVRWQPASVRFLPAPLDRIGTIQEGSHWSDVLAPHLQGPLLFTYASLSYPNHEVLCYYQREAHMQLTSTQLVASLKLTNHYRSLLGGSPYLVA